MAHAVGRSGSLPHERDGMTDSNTVGGPEQRRHQRVTAPLFVIWSGRRMKTTDWSLGGLRIDNLPGDLPSIGDEIRLKLALPFRKFEVAIVVGAEVVRTTGDLGMIAVRFSEVGARERELMTHLLDEVVRSPAIIEGDAVRHGEVSDAQPASTSDDNSLKPVPNHYWPTKHQVATGICAVIGLVLSGYVAMLSYAALIAKSVPIGFIPAPVATAAAAALAEGYIDRPEVRPNGSIMMGERAGRPVDGHLQREIEHTDTELQNVSARLKDVAHHHREELRRIRAGMLQSK